MSIELLALIGVGVILFASILAQSIYTDIRSGLAYTFSSRDKPAPRYGILGHRLDRVVRNNIEGLVLYLPLAVASVAAGITNPWTQWAAGIYLVGRVIYPFAYALGLNPLRSLVWSAAFFALPLFAYGLMSGAAN